MKHENKETKIKTEEIYKKLRKENRFLQEFLEVFMHEQE